MTQLLQLAFSCPTVFPHEYIVCSSELSVTPRAAYSHSASESKRYGRPVRFDIHKANCVASSQETSTTGCLPRPQCEKASFVSHPPAAKHTSHWSNVISNLDTANGFRITTLCCGPSSPRRLISVFGDPIRKVPAGTTTISGQLVQS